MSINFHANQYEQAFAAHRLQNWEVPKIPEGTRPKAHSGFTRIKANDRGHLLPNIPKDRSSPWGKFVGTWDMPRNISGNQVLNPTARSEEAWLKNKKAKEESDVVLSGCLKKCHTVEPLTVKMDTVGEMARITANGSAGQQANQSPCPPVETDHYVNDGQMKDMFDLEHKACLQWPKAKSPTCRSPVGYTPFPKPIQTMDAAAIVPQGDGHQDCPQPAS